MVVTLRECTSNSIVLRWSIFQESLKTIDKHRPKVWNFAEITVKELSQQHFREHFRLEKGTFNAVLKILLSEETLIEELFPHELAMLHCEKKNESYGVSGKKPIRFEKALLVTLWYLANKESMRSIANLFGISKSTVHSLVHRVVILICAISHHFIRWPQSQEDYDRLEQGFFLRGGFPKVLAAIDGCHIKIIAPSDQQTSYLNRNHQHSVNLQGMCSHNKMFLNINVGFAGSAHDARVFRNSQFFLETAANINSNFPSLEHHILGDSAYPTLDWVLTPYKEPPRGNLNQRQKRYNFKHSQTRIAIEHTFGLLKGRFRKLHLVDTDIEFIPLVITACCVLHNICQSQGDDLEEWWDGSSSDDSDSDDDGHGAVGSSRGGFIKRDRIASQL